MTVGKAKESYTPQSTMTLLVTVHTQAPPPPADLFPSHNARSLSIMGKICVNINRNNPLFGIPAVDLFQSVDQIWK